MFRILSFLLLGLGAGILLRKVEVKPAIEKGIRLTIIALLCIFGISIGSNKTLLNNVVVYGYQAAVLSVLGVIGSILAVYLLSYILIKKKGGGK